jgi:16S rRNA (uracil1498-N3)-methyltransferase
MLQRLVIDPLQLSDRHVSLTVHQRHYLCRVLRLGTGDRFVVMNGQGRAWLAALAAPGPESGAELVEELIGRAELPVAVTLVVALPKGNGFDEVVRQCTELGVAEIVPVLSDRTLLHPSSQKLERWRRIAQEAAEQSERQIVPTILEPLPLRSLFTTADLSPGLPPSLDGSLRQTGTRKYWCTERGATTHLLDGLVDGEIWQEQAGGVAIAVGPEGGWTEAEVDSAIAAGYQPVSLGPRILRAVTAPMVALALIAAVCEQRPKFT